MELFNCTRCYTARFAMFRSFNEKELVCNSCFNYVMSVRKRAIELGLIKEEKPKEEPTGRFVDLS